MRSKTTRDAELATTDTASLSPIESDARLVEEVRRGDRDAFGGLVTRYERRLVSVIFRFVRDLELSRDLAQDTFLKAYERLDQFDPSRRFGPWLFRIGVNQALDYLRARKRKGWLSLFSERSTEPAVGPAVPDPRVALDLEQEVRQVLDQIPEKYRTILVLRDLENFSTSEIAAIVNRREATIRWRLAEARTRFQRLWLRRQGNLPLEQDATTEESDHDDEL
ncbi:MAG: sigma-70 family RNA polymerase sigma factor [Planctomycetales bacterium]